MTYTCPYCETKMKDDPYRIGCWAPNPKWESCRRETCNEWRTAYKGYIFVGGVLQCPECGAVCVELKNKDEDAYLAKDIDGWFFPSQPKRNAAEMAKERAISEFRRAIGTLGHATSLCFQAAYKRWRIHVGYPWDVKCQVCHAIMERKADLSEGAWAGGLYSCPSCGREMKCLLNFSELLSA